VKTWLKMDVTQANGGSYRHGILKERAGRSAYGRALFKAYVVSAHGDARKRLRAVVEDSLDPLGAPSGFDPAEGYPSHLDRITLTGYLGEVMTAMVAENFKPGGHDGWFVPAHLFRFHDLAFQELARFRQAQDRPRRVVGRTGDDCLAFILGKDGYITKYLVCEAKCSLTHDSALVNDAHGKFDDRVIVPVGLSQVIEVLKADTSPRSESLQAAVRHLLMSRCAGAERLNLVGYVCGQSPVRRASWMSRNRPHRLYTSRMRLEAVEVHLPDVMALIRESYEDSAVWSG
jgi:hypothetical protein